MIPLRLSTLLLVAASLSLPAAPSRPQDTPPPTRPRLLLSDQLSRRLLVLEPDGSISWEFSEPGTVYDGERLPNGNVLYCWFSGGKNSQAGVREITPDKRIAWEYPVARECHSVQRLPDGLTLIEDPTNKRLIEVNRDGKIVHELKLQVTHDRVHNVARQCRKLPGGTYLVAQELEQAVFEYAADGRILRRFPVDGRPYGVSRLQNGNTLIGAGGGPDGMGRRVVELDPEGNTVWSFEPADFPPETNLDWVLGAHRLANGNTIIAHHVGHGRDGHGISLLEVTPAKQVVWIDRERRIVLLMQVLDR